jgi:AAA domain
MRATDIFTTRPALSSAAPTSIYIPPAVARKITLVPASTYKMRSTKWVWQDYLPLGELALLVGREGLGKSTVALDIAARLSRGTLPGAYKDEPKATIICATEDDWERTIVPRLVAADADRDLVFHVKVTSADGIATGLMLPEDNVELEDKVRAANAGLILLDPLMSRLSPKLDSHKDGEVRQALEPIVSIAHRTDSAVWGLLHNNKMQGRDTGDSIMGSRAFAAVARAILWVVASPDDPRTKVFGLTKSNLGDVNVPRFTFDIERSLVGTDDDGTAIEAGQIVWTGTTDETIDEIRDRTNAGKIEAPTKAAVEWLGIYLMQAGKPVPSGTVKLAGLLAGHADHNIKRAAKKLGVTYIEAGFPRSTHWAFGTHSEQS